MARINPSTGDLLAPSAQVSQYAVKTNSVGGESSPNGRPGPVARVAP